MIHIGIKNNTPYTILINESGYEVIDYDKQEVDFKVNFKEAVTYAINETEKKDQLIIFDVSVDNKEINEKYEKYYFNQENSNIFIFV